jgi:hypothetical protein
VPTLDASVIFFFTGVPAIAPELGANVALKLQRTVTAQSAIMNCVWTLKTPGLRQVHLWARQQFTEPLPMLYSLSHKEYAEPLHALV